MKIEKMISIKAVFVTVCIVFLSFFLGESGTREYGSFLYLIQFMFFSIYTYKKENNYLFLMSPSFITLLYLNFNFILGHYVIFNNYGFLSRFHQDFVHYQSVQFIVIYFLLCNLMVYLAMPKRIPALKAKRETVRKVLYNDKLVIIILLVLVVIFDFIKVNMAVLGGNEEGDLSYPIQLGISIILIALVQRFTLFKRVILYLVLSGVFLLNSFDSKRQFLFVIIVMLLFEIIKLGKNLKLRLKPILIGSALFVSIFYMIVIASISRGYGNYGVENPIQAVSYANTYLRSDFARDALVQNFELNYSYGNATNAINYVYTGKVPLLYGSTFIKFLFLPIPRSIFPEKPRSMIDIYTSIYRPEFRKGGGSMPIILYSEAFWNFHIFGILMIFLLYIIFNKIYLRVVRSIQNDNVFEVKNIIAIYLYVTLIQVIRGSGIELWILYPVIALPVIFLFVYYKKLSSH